MQKEEDRVDYVDVVKWVKEVKVVCIICCGVKEVFEILFKMYGVEFFEKVLILRMYMEELFIKVFFGDLLVEVKDLE